MCAPCERSQAELAPPASFVPRRALGHEIANDATHAPVQPKCNTCDHAAPDPDASGAEVLRAARPALAHSISDLPHRERIQASFGRYDLSHVRAGVGGTARDASDRIGALAFTSGDRIAFRDQPDLRLAAHESAHVIQQREGSSLAGGVGSRGDPWERHADEVADAVVGGRSAEPLLDRVADTSPSLQRAPAVQRDEPDRSSETKDQFAQRVRDRASTRLTQNMAVLDKWRTYVQAMQGFQLRAQLLSGIVSEYAIAAAPTVGGRRRFESFASTDSAQWQAFQGSQLDVDASYRDKANAFMGGLEARAFGYWSQPSVAQRMQVLAGELREEELPPSVWVPPDPRYSLYRGPIERHRSGESGGCQTCHEINWAWGQTASTWGSALPEGDLFRLADTPEVRDTFPRFGRRASDMDPARIARIVAMVEGTPPQPAVTPPPQPQPAAPPDAAAAAAAEANPFVPAIALPVGVERPPPRTNLCGELPPGEDSPRVPALASWGPSSAIVARVIERIDAVLTPLGPRGYRVLGRPSFDALWAMSPDRMETVRDDIVARIGTRKQGYADLQASIADGRVPYEELCPIVDELLPSTNALVQYQARQDVHAWQDRETLLAILELTLIGLSIMFPPSAVLTVPIGMGLGLARMGLGADQMRQGRQWQQGTGAGVYSLSQEAQAPGLADRGRSNMIGGAATFALSALSFGRILSQVGQGSQLGMTVVRTQAGYVVTHGQYPGVVILVRSNAAGTGAIVFQDGQVVAHGVLWNGRWVFRPGMWSPAASGAGGTGFGSSIVPYGGSSIVPYGTSSIVPYGGSSIVPYGTSSIIPYTPAPLALAPGVVAPGIAGQAAPLPFLLGPGPQPFGLLGPGSSHVPVTWNPSPEFNALAPHQLPPVGGPGASPIYVRRPDGSWGLQFPAGAGQGSTVVTYGTGPQASFIVDVPGQSVTGLIRPRTGGTFGGSRSYPMDPVEMTDPLTGTVGARSHIIPHADTPISPVLSTQQAGNYIDHLSPIYNERIRRTLEQRFRTAGHDWFAYNVMGNPPRVSTGGYLIPEAEIIVELGPTPRAWRFPNDPARYASLPSDFDTALAPFQIPLSEVPVPPVQ